ncbi:MAG TPA: DUF2382 domain-containing protein [Leptolyngbyaceae cyanobacterium]
MALLKIGDFDPDYRKSFDESDIKGHGVYTQTDEKIGTVNDILVDEEGHLRYFIVDLGFWIFGKKVLLPVGRTRIDHNAQRVYAVNMTRDQADNLPEFSEDMALDYDYEERVRGVYRTPTTGTTAAAATGAVAPLETSAPLDASVPLDSGVATPAYANYDRNTYSYHHEPDLYNLNEQDHQTLRLYQERLVASKRRVKTGEVAIGKHVETETERVSVPVEKERVIVERVTPTDAGRPVAPGEATFREGEVAHVEVYEETPDIRKEAFVREEVRVRKEVEQEVVNTSETVRREELDVNTGNLPVDERTDRI